MELTISYKVRFFLFATTVCKLLGLPAPSLSTVRRIVAVKSRLQRLNPVESADEYSRLFGELVALEQYARGLREQAIGGL